LRLGIKLGIRGGAMAHPIQHIGNKTLSVIIELASAAAADAGKEGGKADPYRWRRMALDTRGST
jgi:hypothetical protein